MHPAFPVLVWCMIASSKGYLLPDFLLSVCVHIIAEISDSKHMDSLSPHVDCRYSEDLSDGTPVHPTSMAAQTSPFEDIKRPSQYRSSRYDIRQQPVSSARTLVLSIMLRTAFGGMAGDMKMLREYAVQWYRRFFLQANNLACSTSICLPTSISTSTQSLIGDSDGGIFRNTVSSVAMSSYLHPQSIKSTMDFLWGQRCIMVHAISDPDDRTSDIASILADNIDVASSVLLLLRNCILENLFHNSKFSLALYTIAAPPGSLSIRRKDTYNALRLTPRDLVTEGIDFHCDGEIVKAIFDRCTYICCY